MRLPYLGSVLLAATLTLPFSSIAQEGAKQDMKNAGSETKNAAVDTGHGVSKGTKKAYHKTKHGTKKAAQATAHGTKVAADKTADVSKDAYHGTVNGTKKVGDKIAGKPAPQ